MQKMKISKITLHDAASRKPYRTDGSLLKMLYPAMMDITKNGADTGRTGVRSDSVKIFSDSETMK